ncbi:hypothetical protein ACWCSD_50700, partial [Nonomuraea sp. NPDC001684]
MDRPSDGGLACERRGAVAVLRLDRPRVRNALGSGLVAALGQKVEFGVAEGRRGQQALSVRILDQPP